MQAAYHFLVRTLTTQFEMPADVICPDATLESIDLDSLALLEFLVDVQERLDIKLTEDQESALKPSSTLGDVAAQLQQVPQVRLAGLLVEERDVSLERIHPAVTFGELGILPEQAAALLRRSEISFDGPVTSDTLLLARHPAENR